MSKIFYQQITFRNTVLCEARSNLIFNLKINYILFQYKKIEHSEL
jgi:hypothetical protein